MTRRVTVEVLEAASEYTGWQGDIAQYKKGVVAYFNIFWHLSGGAVEYEEKSRVV
jgi:hypothetical protein